MPYIKASYYLEHAVICSQETNIGADVTVDPVTAQPEDDPALEVYTRARRMLFGIAYRILGDAADAEDVLQKSC